MSQALNLKPISHLSADCLLLLEDLVTFGPNGGRTAWKRSEHPSASRSSLSSGLSLARSLLPGKSCSFLLQPVTLEAQHAAFLLGF